MPFFVSVSVSLSSGRRRKSKTSTSKKEEKLLRQLRQITLLMQEGRLEEASPEMEAEEVPYGADWEGVCQNLNIQAPQIILQSIRLLKIKEADFVSRSFKSVLIIKGFFMHPNPFFLNTQSQATQKKPTQCMMMMTEMMTDQESSP